MTRVGILLLVVASAGITAVVSLAAQSPKALRGSILAAARAQRAVHYVTTNVGPIRTRMVADVARDRGIQRITYTKGGRTGHVTVLVVSRIAYVRGDAFTLHSYMGFSLVQSSRYAGRWISLSPPTNSAVAAAVTLPSFVQELSVKGQYARVSSRAGGRKVVGVRTTGMQAGLHVVDWLFARPGRPPLPVEEHEVAPSKGYSSSTTMSRWNEHVRVRAPADAIRVS